MLEFRKPIVKDVIYVEGAVGNIYLESAVDLEVPEEVFSRLRSIALDQEDSIAMAARIAKTYEGA